MKQKEKKNRQKKKPTKVPFIALIHGGEEITIGYVGNKTLTLTRDYFNQIIYLYNSYSNKTK